VIGEVASLFEIGEAVLLATFATFLRVGAAAALLPAFGERLVPARIRLGVAVSFTAIVGPAVNAQYAPLVAQGGMPLWLGAEVLAGLAIGISIRLFVMALEIAGTIAAQSTSLSQIFGNAAVEPLPAMGHILVLGGLALAVMFDLHVRIAEVLIGSYDVFPPGRIPGSQLVMEWGVGWIGSAFALAFTLAAPFVIASLIYNVALGVINRAMPQLMVAFVGAPAITAGGLILLALTAPLMLETWRDAFLAFLDAPFGAP
tara:strand:+ start:4308 stop:5081 length:774 start_codon:yes stop_codon:yes gene_type:complete